MIVATPLLAGLAAGILGFRVGSSDDPIEAREVAVRAATVLLVGTTVLIAAALVGGAMPGANDGSHAILIVDREMATMPIVFATMLFVVVSMAPIASHPPRTLARVFWLVSVALLTIATRIPAVIASMWLLSAWIAWLEVRAQGESGRGRRLFGTFHLVSGICLVGGIVSIGSGGSALGISLIALGIAIREAVLPFHSWFTTFVETMPMGVVSAFAAPQIGVFVHLAMVAEGTPGPLAQAIVGIAAMTAVGAAALGVIQHSARRALAYLMISQTGLVAFGLESSSAVARTGAILNWQVLTLAVAGFAMTLAALEARRGALSLRAPSGCFSRTPRMAAALLCLGFASVGFPPSLGFVAEDLLVQGSVDQFPAISIALVLATALNGITVMRASLYLFSGTKRHGGETDLLPREVVAISVLLAALLAGGMFPGHLDSISGPSSDAMKTVRTSWMKE